MLDVVLPRVKSAREGVEFLVKVIEEKGSAEGNVVVFADQNETWYMEILSGHQYVAVKVPEDKYAVFANTYYLGHVDLNDKENVIASKDVEKLKNLVTTRQTKMGTSILLNLMDQKNMLKETVHVLTQESLFWIQTQK